MYDRPFWLEQRDQLPSLRSDIRADAVVIGGGITGLTVAQLLADRGRSVVVLERDTCGSGATGRSSGFITPDSELQVAQLVRRFGNDVAGRLWRHAAAACEHIRRTIGAYRVDCDFLPADSFYIAAGRSARSTIADEHEARLEVGLASSHYDNHRLTSAIDARGFDSAVRYGGTFAITPHRYAVGVRDRLIESGVRVYERSCVRSLDDDMAVTDGGSVNAGLFFVCADRDLASIGHARAAAYRVQTFLAATEPLPRDMFRRLFPDGDLLVWDTDLIYHYFRRTADDRLLVGGGRLRDTYGPPRNGTAAIGNLQRYVQHRLPVMDGAELTHVWSGLIGVTKDFLPLAGRDRRRAHHFYAGCGAGIPWSVLAAQCVAAAADGEHELEPFFDPHRAFTDVDPMQPIARKPVTFALAHAYTKGLLRGSAQQIRRRRPLVAVALTAAALALARAIRKITASR